MQVGADHVAVARALAPIVAVVAVAVQHPAERLCAGAQMRAAAVVLEAGEHATLGARQVDLDRDVADQPRPIRSRSCGRRAARLREAPRRRVGRRGRAAGSRRRRRARPRRAAAAAVSACALVLVQVRGAELLVAVLAAAHVVEVGAVRVERVADAGAGQLETDPAPLAAPPQHQQVAAVGVDVHQVRIQRADAQRAGLRHRRSPPGCRCAPRSAGSGAPHGGGGRPAGRPPADPER